MRTASDAFEIHGKFLPDYRFRPADWWRQDADNQYHSRSKSKPDIRLRNEFMRLAIEWRESTGGYALTYRRYAHHSYQSILALGKGVVPFILEELRQRPDWWFEALKIF